MAERCRNADQYQALRPPRCNYGVPCDACRRKWRDGQNLSDAYRQAIDRLNRATEREMRDAMRPATRW